MEVGKLIVLSGHNSVLIGCDWVLVIGGKRGRGRELRVRTGVLMIE